MKKRLARAGSRLFLTLASLLGLLFFFTPFPTEGGRALGKAYTCVWEDGTREEVYYSAVEYLEGVDENGNIVLNRKGVRGVIAVEAPAYLETLNTLCRGDLVSLLTMNASRLDPLERAAIFSAYADTLYYFDGRYFAYTGVRVEETAVRTAHTLAVLSGSVTHSLVVSAQARSLRVYPEATISGEALIGTAVEALAGVYPYEGEEGALYLQTPVGARLVCAVPTLLSLTVSGNAFCDKGALSACERLEELTLPFAGNSLGASGETYEGEVAYLFLRGNDYAVPSTLKRITVTGGSLVGRTFYACSSVEEVRACGIASSQIERQAFADLTAARSIHTPLANVVLPAGDFAKKALPCGCTLYERRVNE